MEDATAIQAEIENVLAVAPEDSRRAQVTAKGTNTNTQIVGTVPDYATVRSIAHSVAVMHRGKLVRQGLRETVLTPPFDDYTARLLQAEPTLEPGWLASALKVPSPEHPLSLQEILT